METLKEREETEVELPLAGTQNSKPDACHEPSIAASNSLESRNDVNIAGASQSLHLPLFITFEMMGAILRLMDDKNAHLSLEVQNSA